jgi:hypothetical protein
MSLWSHVNGSIRIDNISIDETREEFLNKIQKLVGKQYSYEDLLALEDREPETILPMGSEGTLKYSIWLNPNRHSVAQATVNIWGDLRDFGSEEDIDKIVKWFSNIINHVDCRSAILEIDVEYFNYKMILILNEHFSVPEYYRPQENLLKLIIINSIIKETEVIKLKNKEERYETDESEETETD